MFYLNGPLFKGGGVPFVVWVGVLKVRRKLVQGHHVSYDPEVVVYVWRGEHHILTLLGRQKEFSRGFLDQLEAHVKAYRGTQVDLEALVGERA